MSFAAITSTCETCRAFATREVLAQSRLAQWQHDPTWAIHHTNVFADMVGLSPNNFRGFDDRVAGPIQRKMISTNIVCHHEMVTFCLVVIHDYEVFERPRRFLLLIATS